MLPPETVARWQGRFHRRIYPVWVATFRFYQDLRVAWRLGPTLPAKARIVAAAIELRRHGGSVNQPLTLLVRLGEREMPIEVIDRSHLWNLNEIWVRHEYGALDAGHADVILDLGANIGVASILLHDRNPRARIIAVEPDPRSVPLLRANTARLQRITVVDAAVGTEEGSIGLLLDHYTWGTRVAGVGVPWPTTTHGPEAVVTTIPRLLERAEVRPGERVLVKMDVEGSEWSILADADGLAGVDEVFGEHHWVASPDDRGAFLAEAAAAAGFTEVPDVKPHLFHWRR